MLPEVPVPRSWRDVTATWMTDAMAARHPGTVVRDVRLRDVEDGTNRRARAELTYARGGGPRSVFVKCPGRPSNRVALLALGALQTEARLATSGVTLPLEHPLPYAAGIDRARLGAVVVMDDVEADGGRSNDARAPLSVDEVASGLEGLARLHAAYWGTALPPSLGFLRPWRLGRGWAAVSVASLARGRKRLARSHDPSIVPAGLDVRRLGRQFRQSALLAATGAQTFLHGDPHPGNSYARSGGRVGFFDWQLARTGHWSHDVGYFLVSSLDADDRRSHERALLDSYLDALRAASGARAVPDREAAWDRYRATPAFGLATWLHTYSFATFQPVDVCTATIRRFSRAYEDLETCRTAVDGRRR